MTIKANTCQQALGVGLMYNPALKSFVRSQLGSYDYLEVTSDMFWTDQGEQATPRFTMIKSWTHLLDWAAAHVPLVAHNIGLSIGTAGKFDISYLHHLRRWHERYGFAWHSDHLSYFKVADQAGATHSSGMAIPLPWDYDALEMIIERARLVQKTIGAPFLLENGVAYIDFPEQEMSEAEFLNALTRRSNCSLLLDLHNLYTNAVNRKGNPVDFIDSIDLSSVLEVHIAGGSEFVGMYTDSHAGACPEAVFDLLEYVMSQVPSLRGVTFEFHDSYFALLGESGVRAQLDRAREIWNTHRASVQ